MSAVRELNHDDRELSIVKKVEANPVMVLVDEKAFNDFYSEIKRECSSFVPDLSTVGGRKEIASLAYKVTRTKTAIDKAGKELNEEARKKINVVDASRRKIREELDVLAETVRKPLTEWEDAEDARIKARQDEIEEIRAAGIVSVDDSADAVRQRRDRLYSLSISPDTHQEFMEETENVRTQSVLGLNTNLKRIEREEEERAELARLRAEAAERDRQEAERLAAEKAERERQEREKAENERKARAAEEEKQRIAQAEERARREAVEAAERREREAEERHAAELRQIEQERAAERRDAEQEAARKASEEKAAREAEEARQRDRDHRSKIMTAAKEAIMEAGTISEAKAKMIVSAIAAGSVPNVTIRF